MYGGSERWVRVDTVIEADETAFSNDALKSILPLGLNGSRTRNPTTPAMACTLITIL